MRNFKFLILGLVFFLLANRNYLLAEEPEKKEVVLPKEEVRLPSPEIPKTEFVITGDQTFPYILDRDDVVRITVLRHPELSGDFIVGPDGKIQYTFVGDVETAGLTKDQLKEKIIELILQYVKVPEISVAIVGYNSKRIYILGEVNRPGMYSLRGNYVSLREAIMQAGLPTKNASLRRAMVIKPDIERPTKRIVNLVRILYEGKLKEDIVLQPGDVVFIPSTVLTKINEALGPIVDPLFKASVIRTIGQ